MKSHIRFLLICLAITLLAATYTIWIFPSLPAKIPVHFNAAGVADRYDDKATGAWFMIWLMLGMGALFTILPAISPKSKSIESFRSSYDAIVFGLMGFFLLLQIAMLQSTTGKFSMSVGITVAVCALIAYLGNFMGKVTPNYFVGIRTPWTLESPAVWERTHRLGAKLMVGAALIGMIAALAGAPTMFIIPLVVIAVLIPVPYSYWIYREQNKATNENQSA